MTTETMTETETPAEMIAAELRAICTEEDLDREMGPDASESASLDQHRSLVQTRLGGSYQTGAWDEALGILRTEAEMRAIDAED